MKGVNVSVMRSFSQHEMSFTEGPPICLEEGKEANGTGMKPNAPNAEHASPREVDKVSTCHL